MNSIKLCPICNVMPARPRGKYCSQSCSDEARRADWQRANDKRAAPVTNFVRRKTRQTAAQKRDAAALDRVVRQAYERGDAVERERIAALNPEMEF
jgi:hypothetical protein